MATHGLYAQRAHRPLTSRLLALLERAGPLTLAEIANRLALGDEKDLIEETLQELGERVVESSVKRGSWHRVKVWSVVGDSRLRALKPLPRVDYRGAEILAGFTTAFWKRQRRQRGR